MGTSWYIVDDEGNVGILDYNSNGPTPSCIEQTWLGHMMLGHSEAWLDNFIAFKLSDEQIIRLLANRREPSEEKSWGCCIVRIDTKKTGLFLELGKKKGISARRQGCISKRLGLYFF